MTYLGIDCGVKGALARWNPEGRRLQIEDMPVFKIKRGKRQPSQIDITELARLIDLMAQNCGLIVIEHAQTIPQTAGIRQAFECGANFGMVKGACAAQFVPMELVPPAQWKRALHCPKDKDGARFRASQLLPEHAGNWTRVKDDGRAESSLLALYAERLVKERDHLSL